MSQPLKENVLLRYFIATCCYFTFYIAYLGLIFLYSTILLFLHFMLDQSAMENLHFVSSQAISKLREKLNGILFTIKKKLSLL